ncbi:MAG: hypothetical protein EOO88_19980 [Pedobacter sp.]|nr:MAG: hypothetical protein EOO88_19980 [Pedobacter sp.]
MISSYLNTFRRLRVEVDIDPLLQPYLDCQDNLSLSRVVEVGIFKLIYVIGTIQTRRYAPSYRQKFTDKSDLLEKIDATGGEFRVRLSNIRGGPGSEALTSISEDFGVGLSVLIARELFNLKDSTIQRLYGSDKRPDWSGQTMREQIVVVESKGSSSEPGRRTQEVRALVQKTRRQADIRVASLTLIKENQISHTRLVDPPADEPDLDPRQQRHVMRAGHYASVFSFLGHSALSRYFTQMRKRILQTISRGEQLEKDRMFFQIRNDYVGIDFSGRTYAGTFTQTGQNAYLFIGVDRELVSYEGFLNFQDHREDEELLSHENYYFRYQDGILVIEITNIQVFARQVFIPGIPNYQQFTTITDIDVMTEFSFEKFWLYTLNLNGFSVNTEIAFSEPRIDIVAFVEDLSFAFELKLFKRRQLGPRDAEEAVSQLNRSNADRRVLVTNSEIPQAGMYALNIIFIGRVQLQQIVRDPLRLQIFLNI